jgi:ABC-type amino acid transport substrate-binding protein
VHAAFALAVLDLAMKSANADYTIRQAKVVMERGRALAELANGDTINLHWTSMGEQAERGLNVVHIPIHRGLIGYRVFIIRRDRQPDFDRINSLDDLKALTAGQGLGWIDTEIMSRAGLNVQTSTYETLFTMTQGGRVDYFPRGVIEAFAELDAREHVVPDLVVENRLLLLYRSDFLFYVARGQKELAATIEKGFTAAYRDGSYMKLFSSHPYIQNPLRRANLAGRKIIRLDNPYLSEADRRIPDEYWMH